MKKLSVDSLGRHHLNHRRLFKPLGTLSPQIVELATDFALRMTYLGEGQHKPTRSGGLHKRSQREIFSDTFQGKIAEFAFLQILAPYLDNDHIEPSLVAAPLGYWEDADVLGPGISMEVKSTKPFGNLLLLEKENWNDSGAYRHGVGGTATRISHVVLVRISPSIHDGAQVLEERYMREKIDKQGLVDAITRRKWTYDLAGFATSADLREVFSKQHLIAQGSVLGHKGIRMDADNYYIQTGDLRPTSELLLHLRSSLIAASDTGRKVEIVSTPRFPDPYEDVEYPDQHWFSEEEADRLAERFADQDEKDAHACELCSLQATESCSCGHEVNCEIECETNPGGIHSHRSFRIPEVETQPESSKGDRRGSRWMRSEDEQLIELFEEGFSFAEIAEKLQRSRGSISSRAHKLYLEEQGYTLLESGQKKEKVQKQTSARIISLYVQGIPVEDISASTGLSVATVAKELMMARILGPVSLDRITYHPEPQTRRLWDDATDALLLEMMRSRKTLKEISEILDRSPWSLLYRLYRLDQISEEATEQFIRIIRTGR